MEKVAVFIDGGYFSKVLKNVFKEARVDYLKFSDNVSHGFERFRTYYYDCMPFQSSPPTDRERADFSNKDKFIYSIRKLPRFDVKLGSLGRRTYRLCKLVLSNFL